jgi:limonene-1,2-epoxide hydrolase
VDDAEAAEACLQRYIKAQEDFDLETLVSCWHPDVEIEHPLRPDRSWKGRETYRQVWSRQWKTGGHRNEIISTAVVGNRVYLEAVVQHGDGTRVPNMNVFEIEDGMIRRGRVYTDVPTHDGVGITDFARDHEGDEGSG